MAEPSVSESAVKWEPVWSVKDAILAIARRWPGYVRLAWALVRDSRVPAKARQWLAAAGAYNLSPIDPIPGIIPVLGQLDDYALLVLAIRRALRASPEEVRWEHLERAGMTEAEIDFDLKEMRRIAGHVTRGAVRGIWAGLQFAAGMGAEVGRQLAVSVARRVFPDSRPRGSGGTDARTGERREAERGTVAESVSENRSSDPS